MLNEWKEFQDYTGVVNYTARNKQDTTYLGRFTFDTILDFEGLNRVLTILARGFLFHNEDGSPAEAPRERIDYAKRGLCAWCSVPDSKKATPREAWQFGSDFGELHSEFPGLVDENGSGWFHRHVHRVADFVRENPERVSSSAQKKCAAIEKGFDRAWRDKVIQMQIPLFAPTTKGQWGLRFDSFLAQALELGPLRNEEPDTAARIGGATPQRSRPRAFPWRWSRRWRPTTLPTSRRIPTGWCCRWPTLTHTSAPPALGESISSKSRRPFWSDLKLALDCAGIGWAAPLSLSRDRIRHPSPLLPLEMDACSFQNDSVRLPVPTPDGIRR